MEYLQEIYQKIKMMIIILNKNGTLIVYDNGNMKDINETKHTLWKDKKDNINKNILFIKDGNENNGDETFHVLKILNIKEYQKQ